MDKLFTTTDNLVWPLKLVLIEMKLTELNIARQVLLEQRMALFLEKGRENR